MLTKLRVPTARPRNIPRAHLLDRLTSETDADFVLVCAPAGYGKTTLLAEWAQSLRQNRVAVAWYSLDVSDDAPLTFGSYLIASLIQALGPVSELAQIAQLLRSSPEIELQRILSGVINAVIASDQECWLILDDYHQIGAPAIHSAFAFLLEHLPENMHIVLGSRSDPPLPLARLRVQGQLLELRAADLRFTPDETTRFLNEMMQLDLSVEMIAILEARTEGWVAGLQLAGLSLAGRSDKERFLSSFTGGHRYLIEYLLEEVINHQPEEVQSFLLSTSILERMCGPLCDAILGDRGQGIEDSTASTPYPLIPSNSQSVLEYLEYANLFLVPLDDERIWYRYHHLFRDFLQTRLQKEQPECVAALHRVACAWYAAHGLLREAVEHALQTQDWDYAASLVEQHGYTMMVHSELSTIAEWCAAFPEEVMQARPLLCILQSWALVLGLRRQNRGRVEALLQQAEQMAAALEDKRLGRSLIEQVTVVGSYLALIPDPAADPRAQLAHVQSRLGLYPEDLYPQEDAGKFSTLLTIGYAHMALHEAQAANRAMQAARQIALRAHLYLGVAETTFRQARLAHSQGQLRHAVEICRQGRTDIAAMLTHPEQELPAVGCLDIALGCVLLEQDRLEAAEQALLTGLDLIGWGMNPYYLMTACLGLYRLREIQGRSAEALDYLTRLEEAWPDIAFCTRGLRVVHSLRTAAEDPATLAEAASWCQSFSSTPREDMPSPGMGPIGAAEVYYLAFLAWFRALIATGTARLALPLLERQLDLALSHSLTDRVIELSLLEAQARRAEGDNQRSWVALERALVAAQPEGYLRIFDQGAALNRLLVEAANLGISREYAGRILSVAGMPQALVTRRESDAILPGAAARSSQASYIELGENLKEHLSDRELAVLRLMARGASNHEIAEQLVITVGTVKSHINHILGKLDAHNRTEAVARARGFGLLDI